MMSFSWPVPLATRISQRFGDAPYSPVQPAGHTGMDFAVAAGTSVKSMAPGTVLWADWATKLSPSNPWYIAPAFAGIVVLIDHGTLIGVYAHLSDTKLNIGQSVGQGQEIGKSGNTGLSSGPHLHLEVIPLPLRAVNAFYGRANPLNYISAVVPLSNTPLASNQRRVGENNVNQRSEPNTGAKVVRIIDGNTIETFTAWVEGQPVDGNNIWYKDSTGYAWSGGFTEQKTAGLPDQTPKPPKAEMAPNQRKVIPGGAIQRKSPDRTGEVVRNISGNTIETFTGYVHGEPIPVPGTSTTSDIWFRDTIGYVWCGGFTTSSIVVGLPDQTPKKGTRVSGTSAIAYRKEPRLDAEIMWYLEPNSSFVFDSFTHGDSFGGTDIWYRGAVNKYWAHSSLFTSQWTGGMSEVFLSKPDPVIPTPEKPTPTPAPAPETSEDELYSFTPDFDFVEYKPANYWNMGNGNFPTNPVKIVIHQFNAKELRPSIDGVISHFQTPRPKAPSSAHFGVSGDRIVQFVSLQDRAYHAGPEGNDFIGIEVDPQEDEATIASVQKLIKALNNKYGKVFTYSDHRSIKGNNTLCGADIHLEKYSIKMEQDPALKPTQPSTPALSKSEIDSLITFLTWYRDTAN